MMGVQVAMKSASPSNTMTAMRFSSCQRWFPGMLQCWLWYVSFAVIQRKVLETWVPLHPRWETMWCFQGIWRLSPKLNFHGRSSDWTFVKQWGIKSSWCLLEMKNWEDIESTKERNCVGKGEWKWVAHSGQARTSDRRFWTTGNDKIEVTTVLIANMCSSHGTERNRNGTQKTLANSCVGLEYVVSKIYVETN